LIRESSVAYVLKSGGYTPQRVKGLDELEGYERALSDEGDAVSHAFSLAEPAGEDAVLTHCMQLLWSLLPDTAANFSVARCVPTRG
jgi:hypothetical protein